MSNGSILIDIGFYKEKITEKLTSCADICELIINKNTYTSEEIEDLMYRQIFPYLYYDETMNDILTYLCFEVDIPKTPTRTTKDMKLIIWVYSHKDDIQHIKDGYSGTKVDILADMIERQLRNCDDLGIGKPELQSVSYFLPGNKYYGKQLIYNIPDFKISR